MADSGSRATSIQYTYCAVCRRNHDQGRKHIFTKHHKEKLAGILAKILKKVRNKLTYIIPHGSKSLTFIR